METGTRGAPRGRRALASVGREDAPEHDPAPDARSDRPEKPLPRPGIYGVHGQTHGFDGPGPSLVEIVADAELV